MQLNVHLLHERFSIASKCVMGIEAELENSAIFRLHVVWGETRQMININEKGRKKHSQNLCNWKAPDREFIAHVDETEMRKGSRGEWAVPREEEKLLHVILIMEKFVSFYYKNLGWGAESSNGSRALFQRKEYHRRDIIKRPATDHVY